MDIKKIAVVGAGWRAMTWFNVINTMPGFSLDSIVVRNSEKAEMLKKQYPNTKILADVKQLGNANHVLLCVNKASNVALSCELVNRGFSVFCETPAGIAADLSTDSDNLSYGENVNLQITEQYPLRPRIMAVEKLIDEGYFGEVHTVEISCCHSYHAVAVARKILKTGDKMPKITKFVIDDEYYESDGRNGKKEPELKNHKRTIALLDFGDKRAIYDFSHGQYFSSIRGERISVKGTKGEYINGSGYRLVNGSEIPFSVAPVFSGADCGLHALDLLQLTCDGKVLFENPFIGCRFSEEEIAMALWLKNASDKYRRGEPIYSLKQGAIDVAIAAKLDGDNGKINLGD